MGKLSAKTVTLGLLLALCAAKYYENIEIDHSETDGYKTSARSMNSVSDEKLCWPVPSCNKVLDYYNDVNRGIGIYCEGGDVEVVAVMNGTVVEARGDTCCHVGKGSSDTCNEGLGNYVVISHKNGVKSKYYFLKYKSLTVKKGDIVKKGAVIGFMGNSGISTKQHLYFQLIDSSNNTINVNPGAIDYDYSEQEDSKFKEKWKVLTDNLNLRSYPNANSKIVVSMSKGMVFELESKKDVNGTTWGKTIYQGYSGWVCLKYAKLVKKAEKPVDKGLERVVVSFNFAGGNSKVTCRGFNTGSVIDASDLIVPIREGYRFAGWYMDKDYCNELPAQYLVNDDVTLYAKWA